MDTDSEYSMVESAQEVVDGVSTVRTDWRQTPNNYYVEEFQTLFRTKQCLRDLRQNALKNGLRSCRFRSICWRIFLECLPESSEERVAKMNELRANYDKIRDQYNNDPRDRTDIKRIQDNPLSQETNSQWHRYFSDSDLRLRITQDVVRTFPEIDFFQLTQIQTLMTDILFHYARENPAIEYKQGMHELLAPLLFVIHCDQQTFLHAQELGLIEDEIILLLNPYYLEHDTYFLFAQVMESVESWYHNNSIQSKLDLVNLEPFSSPPESNLCSILGVKLKKINEQIVRRQDYDLFHHLMEMEIAPQIYGIRWMRLLFGREFQMQDLLVVWDAIFADGVAFALCDYIFASMLIVIRRLLLASDYAQCLNHLMRYPSVPDIHYIIHMALHIRDPLNYSEPIGFSSLVMPNSSYPTDTAPHTSTNNQPTPTANKTISNNGKMSASVSRPSTLSISLTNNTNTRQKSIFSPKNVIMPARQLKEMKHISSSDVTNDEQDSEDVSSKQELSDLKTKIEYCWTHMTGQLEVLQKCLAKEQLEQEDDAMIALAELKKVRDFLKGTLKFSPKE